MRGALIEKLPGEDPRLGALRRLGPLAKVGADLFEAAVRARRFVYDSGILVPAGTRQARVLSVGNLRMGGSGKTPLCLWLVEQFTSQGICCGLSLRGYKGQLESGVAIVSGRGDNALGMRELGDEASLAVQRLRGQDVVIAVGRRRVQAVQELERRGAEVIIVDDGFSHWRLRRDTDLVLVCPEDLLPQTRLLPAGPLRESASALERATLVLGLAQDWRGKASTPQVLLDVRPVGLVDRQWRCHDLEVYRDCRVLLASGIARPGRFADTARQAGLQVLGHACFPDHMSPSRRQTQALIEQAMALGAQAIVWTEKDLPRLPPLPLPSLALRIELRPVVGASLLDRVIWGA